MFRGITGRLFSLSNVVAIPVSIIILVIVASPA
jgi:hypothetical protein